MLYNDVKVYTASVDPASLTTELSAEQDVTVTGVAVGDVVLLATHPTAFTTGYELAGARVKDTDVVSLAFMNVSTGTINPGAQTFTFYMLKPFGTTGTVEV